MLPLMRAHGIPQVKEVAFHDCGSARRICVLRFHDLGGVRTHNSVVWQALFAALSIGNDWPKVAIAVDESAHEAWVWSMLDRVLSRITRSAPEPDAKIVIAPDVPLDDTWAKGRPLFHTPVAFDGRPVMAALAALRGAVPLLAEPEDAFVEAVLRRIPPTPPNHLHIVMLNEAGELPEGDPTLLEAGANRCAVA